MKWHIEVRPDDPTRGHFVVECERGYRGECPTPVWAGPAQGVMWHWDGNVEQPTISPSIDCKGGCGRHFTMIKGQPT